ncbi:MAG: hypothetical protein KAU16_00345 [Methanophagales archaeon]|nr:hypothetical protein [Methanophagales archaeon]
MQLQNGGLKIPRVLTIQNLGKKNPPIELKMYEKELYPAVEKFLMIKKNCLSEYIGSELSLKRGKTSLRAEGVWSIKIKSR